MFREGRTSLIGQCRTIVGRWLTETTQSRAFGSWAVMGRRSEHGSMGELELLVWYVH